MKKFIGAIRFRFGDKVRKHGQRIVMERMPQLWIIRVRLFCRDPESGKAYRLIRDIQVNQPARLAQIYPVISMATDELLKEANNQHHGGGWFALALPRKKSTK